MRRNIEEIFNRNNPSKSLFILEMANNHMGDVDHGLNIIRSFHKVTKKFNFNFAFKFQFRDIDTFIHPDYKKRTDIKYVQRFSETRLSEKDFIRLKKELIDFGYVTICTPFDERSVDLIDKLGFDIIKIGSCSFADWPLLERIVKSNKPVIASTGGADLSNIDNVVNFFTNRNKKLAIMHCIGEYPTFEQNLQLNQIDLLRNRYPNITIGFSTHEEPDNTLPIQIAIAKGATIFERHVSVKTKQYEINKYSSNPEQVDSWLMAAKRASRICGLVSQRAPHCEKEIADLRQFQRGVFAKQFIKKGDQINLTNTFFAFPNKPKQLVANDMSKYHFYYAKKDFRINENIQKENVKLTNARDKIYSIAVAVDKIINESSVTIPSKVELEVSHHYGIEKFDKVGLCMITVVNRDYCKKLLIMLPGQSHPVQYHKKKEETFHILFGEFKIELNGKKQIVKTGDVIVIKPKVKHAFSTIKGGILEEISSTHFVNDSYYIDSKIGKNKNRKTHITYWRNI